MLRDARSAYRRQPGSIPAASTNLLEYIFAWFNGPYGRRVTRRGRVTFSHSPPEPAFEPAR